MPGSRAQVTRVLLGRSAGTLDQATRTAPASAPAILHGTCPCHPKELVSTRERVSSQGRRYSGANLDGAIMDVDHALFEGGFGSPEIKRTGDLSQMVHRSDRSHARASFPNAGPRDGATVWSASRSPLPLSRALLSVRQMVMTTLPRAWPSLRYRIAAGTSSSGNVLSTTGLMVPASSSVLSPMLISSSALSQHS